MCNLHKSTKNYPLYSINYPRPDNSKKATQQNGCFIPQYFAGNLEPTEIKSVTTKHYSGLILDLGFLILDFYI
ncbi:hypothetical protein H9W95_10125 [Flavobacterium lindanitolerans]|nr:hypothetical protein [Flavobacterium lindanitolerans]